MFDKSANRPTCLIASIAIACLLQFPNPSLSQSTEKSFNFALQTRIQTEPESANFHVVEQEETWKPSETAIIVCDMWDLHHCHNAVIRVGQLAPRMNKVLIHARSAGATIIHAPSGCVDFYNESAARRRALETKPADNMPEGISDWCSKIPAEEAGTYPIDQSDGGEDDDPADHAEWAKQLEERGLDPKVPWSRQTEAITIDEAKDYISDSGPEIWSILESRQIKNVVLVGVHTNMCVLGRPFGLRQLAKNGKNVVLMRDMTDSMYNPAAKPFVSHFSGTDLIVEHIEKFVCPTITSDQLLGGEPFVFANDNRQHLAIVIGEAEYETDKTLPAFAETHLRKDFRISYVFASKKNPNDFPGISVVKDADILFLSVRRRTPTKEQLNVIREFSETRKPMIGIRTSSHAFCLRKTDPPKGLDAWPEFDQEVWGGNYTGHSKNGKTYSMTRAKVTREFGDNGFNVFLVDVDLAKMKGHMSLYKTNPLGPSTDPIIEGNHPDEDENQPVAWTNVRAGNGISFYTSLGHENDFAQKGFQKLLLNAITVLSKNSKTAQTK